MKDPPAQTSEKLRSLRKALSHDSLILSRSKLRGLRSLPDATFPGHCLYSVPRLSREWRETRHVQFRTDFQSFFHHSRSSYSVDPANTETFQKFEAPIYDIDLGSVNMLIHNHHQKILKRKKRDHLKKNQRKYFPCILGSKNVRGGNQAQAENRRGKRF